MQLNNNKLCKDLEISYLVECEISSQKFVPRYTTQRKQFQRSSDAGKMCTPVHVTYPPPSSVKGSLTILYFLSLVITFIEL